MTRPLFSPAAPPEPTWLHFPTRDQAAAHCAEYFPPNLQAIGEPIRGRTLLQLSQDLPTGIDGGALVAWARVYDGVVRLCPRAAYVDHGNKKSAAKLEPPRIVTAAAGDAALAAIQLYIANRIHRHVFERREKWAVFAAGYGCIGYYGHQAVTYDPPLEIRDRRPVFLTAQASSAPVPASRISPPVQLEIFAAL